MAFTPYNATSPTTATKPVATPAPAPSGFVSDVTSALQRRGADLNTTLESNQTPISKGLNIVGQGAGFVGDVIGAGIKKVASVLPNAKTEGDTLAADPLVQLGAHALEAGGKVWSSFQAAHPEIAGDAEAIGNIVSLLPGGAGAKIATGVAKEVVPAIRTAVDTAKTASEAKAAESLLKTAVQDATPAYSKKLIGEAPVDGVPRVQEGGGIIKTRTVTPTPAEIEAGTELSRVPGYGTAKTSLEKFNVIEPEIARQARELETSLKNENVLRPPKEIAKIIKTAVNTASEDSVLLQKTDPIVKNYLRVANRAIEQSDGTLAGELRVRQILDNAYDDAGGKYGNNKGLDQIHRAARNAINDDLEAKALNTEVKASLKRQRNLFKAQDVLQDKARAEGGSALEQAIKAHPITSKVVGGAARATGLGGVINLVN